MQGHRFLRAVSVLVLIVALLYLVLALGGSLWLRGSGFGSGWGTGSTGWLVLPLAGSAIMAALTLMVFGLMLFFLARIDENLTAARLRPRPRRRPKAVAPPVVAAPSSFAPPPVSVEPAVASTRAVEAYLPPAEEPSAAASEAVVSATPLPEPPAVEDTTVAARETEPAAAEEPAEPRRVFGEQAGEVVIPGGVLPSVEIAEEERAAGEPAVAAEPAAATEAPAEAEPPVEETAPAAEPVEFQAAPSDLVLREPVQIEVEAGQPEIGVTEPEQPEPPVVEGVLPAVEIFEEETRQVEPEVAEPAESLPEAESMAPEPPAPEVRLRRVDLEAIEPELETEDMVTPGREPGAEPAEEAVAGARLPEVEVTELPAEAPQTEETVAALSEETGVPEPEISSGVPAEAPAAQEEQTSAEAPSTIDALQAQLAALQAQLASLQSQLNQQAAPPPAPAASVPPDELPEEPASDDPPAEQQSGKLPGSDEVARIAAEMNAAKKPKRPAPAMPPTVSATMRAPQARAADGGDNLEIIMGVGPIYAKRLRELGVTTYEQLAGASYEILDKVTRGNLERVIKEDWRGQARRLMDRE